MGLVDVDEDDPAIARQGTEEDESLRADDDGSLARRPGEASRASATTYRPA